MDVGQVGDADSVLVEGDVATLPDVHVHQGVHLGRVEDLVGLGQMFAQFASSLHFDLADGAAEVGDDMPGLDVPAEVAEAGSVRGVGVSTN